MGKVDRTLGREIRRRRIAGGDTLESLSGICGVSEKTIGKWERGEAMPSATNIRMLEKFGLIEDWLGRNGGNGQHPQGARQGGNDRIARTSEHAGSERWVPYSLRVYPRACGGTIPRMWRRSESWRVSRPGLRDLQQHWPVDPCIERCGLDRLVTQKRGHGFE